MFVKRNINVNMQLILKEPLEILNYKAKGKGERFQLHINGSFPFNKQTYMFNYVKTLTEFKQN